MIISKGNARIFFFSLVTDFSRAQGLQAGNRYRQLGINAAINLGLSSWEALQEDVYLGRCREDKAYVDQVTAGWKNYRARHPPTDGPIWATRQPRSKKRHLFWRDFRGFDIKPILFHWHPELNLRGPSQQLLPFVMSGVPSGRGPA